jgi:hypothetical protein
MLRGKIFVLVVLSHALLFSAPSRAQEAALLHPTSDDPYYSSRDKYFIEMLNAALRHIDQPPTLRAKKMPAFKEGRSRVYLQNKRYDIHWLMTNSQLEEELHPVRIPLYKGLIGWRVFLIQEKDQAIFSNIQGLAELQQLSTAQGHDWPDVAILTNSNLRVYSSPSWNGLFEMLELGRIHYLPRSVIEITDELAQHPTRHFTIERELILRYPAAYYYFLHKDQQELGQKIDAALLIMQGNGEFDAIFDRYFADKVDALDLHRRRHIIIENPNMHPDTPAYDSKRWFQVDSPP